MEPKTKNPTSVIIIGGGVAGITAGSKLDATGKVAVTLLEASDRIGGRIFSDKFDGHSVEMGAEWIHGEAGNGIFELVSAVSLDSLEMLHGIAENRYWSEAGYQFITQQGQVLDESFNAAITELMQSMEDDPTHVHDNNLLSKAEVAQRIYAATRPLHHDPAICSAGLDWIHRYWNSYDASDHWSVSSYYGTKNQYLELPGIPNISWKLPAAYSTLLSIILTGKVSEVEIPPWIQLNREVTEIKYSVEDGKESVTVKSSDGTKLQADHVICTVPLGVLKDRHKTLFQPNLSEEKQRTIENLGFGVVDKIHIGFESAWWPDDFSGVNILWNDFELVKSHWSSNPTSEELLAEYDGIPVWCRNLLGFHTIDGHPTALRTWMTGVVARFVETLDKDYIRITCHKVMQKFLGHLYSIPDPISIQITNWYTNPFFQGSYSFRTVESEKCDIWASYLASPILNSDGKPVKALKKIRKV